MKRKGIIFVLFALTIISMSCSNSKAVVVGAGEKSETNEAKIEKKENEVLNSGRLEKAPKQVNELKLTQPIKVSE
jgi:hypothetical protein